MVPSDSEKPNESMLQLHDMTDQYHKLAKGITATRLKLDALERYNFRLVNNESETISCHGSLKGRIRVLYGTREVAYLLQTALRSI